MADGAAPASLQATARAADTGADANKDDPITRQMIDKRTSRRNNRDSFVAAIDEWRSELYSRKPRAPGWPGRHTLPWPAPHSPLARHVGCSGPGWAQPREAGCAASLAVHLHGVAESLSIVPANHR